MKSITIHNMDEDLEVLKNIKSENDVRNSRLKYYVAYTDNPNEIQNEGQISSRWGELGVIHTWEEKMMHIGVKIKEKLLLKLDLVLMLLY